MRVYIKGDYSKGLPYNRDELAQKMWFSEDETVEVDFSYAGYYDFIDNPISIHFRLNKWMHDKRWNDVSIKKGISNEFGSHIYEDIHLDYEDEVATDYNELGEHLRILTTHSEPLTIDRRAALHLAVIVATAIDGMISEDDKETWITAEEFQIRHQSLLGMSFEEANEISLKEISEKDDIRDPLWAEEEARRQTYLAARTSQTFGFE